MDATEVRFTAYQSGDAFTVWDHYTDTLVDDEMPTIESAEGLARTLTGLAARSITSRGNS